MKPAPLLFAVALAVLLAWPLSSAIGAAKGRPAAPGSDIQAVGCVPEASAEAPPDDELALPPGHPSLQELLPPGHPSVDAPQLPPGHPPIPSGHPPIQAAPLPFEAPVLLTI